MKKRILSIFIAVCLLVMCCIPQVSAVAIIDDAAISLAAVLLTGCGVTLPFAAGSDGVKTLVTDFLESNAQTREYIGLHAQAIVGGQLKVTRAFLDGMTTFYDVVKTYFATAFASADHTMTVTIPSTIGASYSGPASTLVSGNQKVSVDYSKAMALQFHDKSVGVKKTFYLTIKSAAVSGKYDIYIDGVLKHQNVSSGNVGGWVSVQTFSGMRADRALFCGRCPIGSDLYWWETKYTDTASGYSGFLIDQTDVVITPNLTVVNPAIDAGLTGADVLTGWSRGAESIDDPDAERKPAIVIPADILLGLQDKVASDVWPTTDAGTGGEVVGDTTGILNGIKDLVGGIGSAIGSLGDSIAGFFDSPADFELDMDGFKDIIIPQKFPFCIPFDFVNSIRSFAQNPKNYELKIDVDTQYFKVNHVVDLSPFSFFFAFFRYGATVWFAIVLITKTRSMIKW